jgi:hypothetical protein
MIWNKGFFGKERALIPNHEVCKVDQGESALCEEFCKFFGTVTQNLPTPNETSTMACTQHIP